MLNLVNGNKIFILGRILNKYLKLYNLKKVSNFNILVFSDEDISFDIDYYFCDFIYINKDKLDTFTINFNLYGNISFTFIQVDYDFKIYDEFNKKNIDIYNLKTENYYESLIYVNNIKQEILDNDNMNFYLPNTIYVNTPHIVLKFAAYSGLKLIEILNEMPDIYINAENVIIEENINFNRYEG